MSLANPSHIQSVIHTELPDMEGPQKVGTGLAVVVVFIFSVLFSSFLGVILVGIGDYKLHLELPDWTYIVVAVVAPFLSFTLGYVAQDSLFSLRVDDVRTGSQHSSRYNYQAERDKQTAGCLLFLVQAAAGGVYTTAIQLRDMAKPQVREGLSDLELATSIVSYLLEHGATSSDELSESLVAQGVDRTQLASVMKALRSAAIFDPTSITQLNIHPMKRGAFLG